MKKGLLLTLGTALFALVATAGIPAGLAKSAPAAINVAPKSVNTNAIFTGAKQITDLGTAETLNVDTKSIKKAPAKKVEADENGIIYETPEGTLKQYLHTSSYILGGYLYDFAQFSDVVFDNDGTTVWIKDIVGSFEFGSWVKGTLNETGDEITVALGQPIGTINLGSSVVVNLSIVYPTIIRSGEITLSITDDAITPVGFDTYSDGVLGGSFSFNSGNYTTRNLGSSFPWGDYAIAYTVFNEPELVTLPDGLEAKEYPYSASRNASDNIESTVKVAWSGNDVYIQGLLEALPEAWVKGTLDGVTISFDIQYVGKDETAPYFFAGYSEDGPTVATADYDADLETIAFNGTICFNSGADTQDFLVFYNGSFIGTAPQPVEVPEGLETTIMPLIGEIYSGSWTDVNTQVKVGWDGNDVYIQGLLTDVPEGWVKGTLDGDTLRIPNQYVGLDNKYSSKTYILGYNNNTGEVEESKFYFYNDLNVLQSTNLIFSNGKPNALYYNSYYWSGLLIGVPDEVIDAIEITEGENIATFFDVFDVARKVDDNTTIFTGKLDEDKNWVELTEVEGKVIPAGSAVILKSTQSTITLTYDPSTDAALSNNDLVGNYSDIDAPADSLFLLNVEEGVANLKLNAEETTVPAGSAYIPVANAAEGINTLPFTKPILGDVNSDGIVDVSDVVALANHVMGETPDIFNVTVANINGDELTDVSDVVALANIVMGSGETETED